MSKVVDEKIIEEKPKLPFISVYLLGVAMKIGCLSVTWNFGLAGGFYEYFLIFLTISSAYFCLCLCMSEMVSIMSFSGGYYGYARCAIGPLGGFLVGCSGAWESMVYVSIYVLRLGMIAEYAFDKWHLKFGDQPYIWIVIYASLILIHIGIAKYFWNTMAFLGISCLLLITILLFGSMEDGDFNKYALHGTNGFQQTNDYWTFLSVFRMSIVFYLGFDMITLTASEVEDSKKTIPKVMIALFVTLFVLAIAVSFAICSNAPGATPALYKPTSLVPTAYLFAKIFNINDKQASIISGIFPLVSAIGYLHIVSRQIKSMSTSGLLPPIFKITWGKEEIPLIAMIFVAIFAFFINYFAYHEGIYTMTSRMATMGGCFVYLAMFYCFIVFRLRYGHLERSFRNPLGIASAIYGSILVLAIVVILFYFKETLYFPASSFYGCYIGFMLVYYYLYAENHQCFSASEQKVFFKAYILNMQMRKKKAIHKRFASDMVSLFFAPFLPVSARNSISTSRNRETLNTGDRKTNHSNNSRNSNNTKEPHSISKTKYTSNDDSKTNNDSNFKLDDDNNIESIPIKPISLEEGNQNLEEPSHVGALFDQDLDKPIASVTV